jgi:hypothetical protein
VRVGGWASLLHPHTLTHPVYRGVKVNLINEYQKGETVVWWGFSSCTTSIDTLQSDHFLGKTGTRTIFVIECYSGKDIRKHSCYPKEGEMLLLAATQLRVVSRLDQDNGLHLIQLQETQPPFPLLQPVSIPRINLELQYATPAISRSTANSVQFDNV